MDSLKAWNSKLLPDKIFAKFKLHMREEHHALRQVGALTIRDSEFSQTNMIQQLTDHQQQLTQESNLQLASIPLSTLRLSLLRSKPIISQTLRLQMHNCLHFWKLCKIKLTDWNQKHLLLLFRLILPPILGLEKNSNDIFFPVVVAYIREKIVPRKSQDIRMMQHSKTEWVAVMIIVCPIVRDWWGEQTYTLIYWNG